MDNVIKTLKDEEARLERRLKAVRTAIASLDDAPYPALATVVRTPATPARKKRVLSAASREKLAAAGRKRWANHKKST